MNPDDNKQDPNQPQIIAPQWQYTSGNLSQQAPISPAPEPPTEPEKKPIEGTFQIRGSEPPVEQPNETTAPVNPIPAQPAIETPPQPASPAQPEQPQPKWQPEQAQEPETAPITPPTPTPGPEIQQPATQQPTEQPEIQPDQNQTTDSSAAVYSWQASEFASNEKNGSWYLLLIIATVLLSAITFFLTKEWFSIVVIVVLAIAVGFYGNIKPRALTYTINETGIKVGHKFYSFSEFKSFAIFDDMAVPSLQLMPVKKLMMPLNIYVLPSEIEKISQFLGNYLPFEDRKRDFTDKLSHRLKF